MLALGESDEAELNLDRRQPDHWYPTVHLLEVWAPLANFPDGCSPAERGKLIATICDQDSVSAHIEAHWTVKMPHGHAASENSEQCAAEFVPPLLPLSVRWLSALARQSGLIECDAIDPPNFVTL